MMYTEITHNIGSKSYRYTVTRYDENHKMIAMLNCQDHASAARFAFLEWGDGSVVDLTVM